ncbi:MAG TPA: glycosyltransferase [Humisphaera sp.]|nr:glycosyltransferase [Humisphaera sp.]
MTPPLVSVVIPTYNRAALLLETLASVFAQTFTDYEVLIVDDGSTDDTLEQLRPIVESRGERVRIISQDNRGIGVARNRGIDEARGKYVALLDHDDLWLPRKLQTQVDLFKRHPEIVAASVPFSFSSAPTVPAFDANALEATDGVIAHPMRTAGEGHNFTLTSTLMFDRQKASGLRHGEVRGVAEDIQFQIGLLARGPFGVAGTEILAIYRLHADNFSRQADYYVGGIRLLRQMVQTAAFREVRAEDFPHMLRFIAGLGRAAAVKDLTCGNRLRGMKTYFQEFFHQLRERRFKFLLTFPLLALCGPERVTRLSTRDRR